MLFVFLHSNKPQIWVWSAIFRVPSMFLYIPLNEKSKVVLSLAGRVMSECGTTIGSSKHLLVLVCETYRKQQFHSVCHVNKSGCFGWRGSKYQMTLLSCVSVGSVESAELGPCYCWCSGLFLINKLVSSWPYSLDSNKMFIPTMLYRHCCWDYPILKYWSPNQLLYYVMYSTL